MIKSFLIVDAFICSKTSSFHIEEEVQLPAVEIFLIISHLTYPIYNQ